MGKADILEYCMKMHMVRLQESHNELKSKSAKLIPTAGRLRDAAANKQSLLYIDNYLPSSCRG